MSIDWPLVLARWLQFGSVMALFGGALLQVICPSMPSGFARFWPAFGFVAVLSALAWLAGQIASVTGALSDLFSPSMLHVFFFETPFGHAWLARLLILVLLAGTTLRGLDGSSDRQRGAVVLTATAILLISQAWLGHTAVAIEAGNWWVVIAYVLHVLGAGTWAGGLPALMWLLSQKSVAGSTKVVVLRRFSLLATAAMAAVIVGAVIIAASRVTNASQLIETTYGRLIVAKCVLLAGALVLGARNLLIETNWLGDAAHASGAEYRLRRNIWAEILLGTGLLLAAAVLGMSAPP